MMLLPVIFWSCACSKVYRKVIKLFQYNYLQLIGCTKYNSTSLSCLSCKASQIYITFHHKKNKGKTNRDTHNSTLFVFLKKELHPFVGIVETPKRRLGIKKTWQGHNLEQDSSLISYYTYRWSLHTKCLSVNFPEEWRVKSIITKLCIVRKWGQTWLI